MTKDVTVLYFTADAFEGFMNLLSTNTLYDKAGNKICFFPTFYTQPDGMEVVTLDASITYKEADTRGC